jgi:hypothetical protein
MLEWLRDGGTGAAHVARVRRVPSGLSATALDDRTTRRFLVEHPVGATLLQVALAALVLLLALGPRALPPVDVLRVERRDPLEQIDALAHAYEQVRATRTLTARLLHGVRSRVERGWSAARARPNEDFLADAERQVPRSRRRRARAARARRERSRTQSSRARRRARAIEQSLTTSTHA